MGRGSPGVGSDRPKTECPGCGRQISYASMDRDGNVVKLRRHKPCGTPHVDMRAREYAAARAKGLIP